MNKVNMKELWKREEKVKPIEGNTYSMQDAVLKTEVAMRENPSDLGELNVNPDGTLAEINAKFLAVDTSLLYMNHFKKIDDKSIAVACGPLAYLSNKAKNIGALIPEHNVPVFIIKRDGKGELKCTGLKSVSDKEFVDDFNKILSDKVMEEILPLTKEYGIAPSKSDLPI